MHRLRLTRGEQGPTVTWVMLNPSVADQQVSDPTIRRVEGFSWRWGFGSLIVVNLWSRRATRPQQLKRLARPGGGRRNDAAIRLAAGEADRVVVAWGVHGAWRARDRAVLRLLGDRELWCLGHTRDGHPRHPLFVRGDQPLLAFRRPVMLPV